MLIIKSYFTILLDLFKSDVEILSNPWMYIPFLIPACFYLVFFFIKWTILTTPMWLPINIIVSKFKSAPKQEKD